MSFQKTSPKSPVSHLSFPSTNKTAFIPLFYALKPPCPFDVKTPPGRRQEEAALHCPVVRMNRWKMVDAATAAAEAEKAQAAARERQRRELAKALVGFRKAVGLCWRIPPRLFI